MYSVLHITPYITLRTRSASPTGHPPVSEIPHNGSPSRSGLGSLVFCTSSRTSFDNPPIQRPLSSLRQIPSKWPVRALLSLGYPISISCCQNIFFFVDNTDGVWFGNTDLNFCTESKNASQHHNSQKAHRNGCVQHNSFLLLF